MQNSFCRFGKISSGFCNQAFLQYGCKRAFTSSWGCMLGSFCRFGKISLGFGNHASLSNGGKMGINGRTPSAELSKPWRRSSNHVQRGVGNADQSWYGVSKRRMDRKSQSLGPRLKFQLSHVLLQSNVGAQVLLSQA